MTSSKREILEVGLDSPDGQTLVPKTRVHADFRIRHADPLSVNSEMEPNEPYSAYAPQTKGVVDSTAHNRNLQIPVSQIHSSNHGYVPLKDAPGFRNLILDQHKQLVDQMPNTVIKGDQLHETSLSDQRGDEKFGPSSVVLDDGLSEAKPTGNSGFVRSASYSGGSASITGTGTGLHTSADMDANDSAGNGSRPALEMSMYILLGLFALVGLVFAVNCGAVVARYRWERIGRRRTNVPPSADTDGVTDVERDMSQLAHSESGQKSITKTAESTGTGLEPNADQIGESSLRRCSKFLIPFKNKNKAVLHRDTNWVWIGRDKTGETQGNQGNGLTPSPLVDCHRSANSPLLGTADVPKTGAPTASSSTTPSGAHGPVSGVERSNGRKQNAHNLNTTAVLSVGEADMLLLHSPYHQDAWQDTLRSTSADRDTMAPFAIGWPYTVTPGVSQDPHGLLATSSTVGRPPRRHTAGALTQRNYQGQECSIRIISNPMPQPMSSPHNGQESADSASQEHAQEKNVSQHWLAYYQPDGLQIPQGSRTPVSASASVSRKQRTPIASWTSKDQRGDNDRAGSNYVQIDWNSGSRPNPYPRMQIPPPHHVPSTLIPPPNHPAPPIPYGHLRPKDAAYYWEAIMYRSWVRPRSGWKIPQSVSDSTTTDLAPTQTSQDWSPWNVRTRRSLSNASEAIGDSLSREANHISQWDYIRSANMLKTLRESREHTFNRSTEMPVNVENLAPFPPVRTTSRTVESQTLEADKAKRKVSLDANPRPLSLPQNFQATNELYGAVTQDSLELGGTSGDLEAEHQAKPKGGRSAGGPDTSPSEESLWWYHPVRRRPRKRRHEQNPHRQHPAGPQASRTHGHRQDHHVHEQGAGDASVPQNRYAPNKPLLCGQPDPIEYACPAPCDCDCGQPPLKAMHTGGNPGAPRIPHLIPTATETDNKTGIPAALLHSSTLSGLAWDQDLLALSHDRLVAYFAGMKESDA
ncbi:hypothetical protein D915_003220 [Fasciola hepatica]|uniref:Uncharacterized protein n=1 Tax=Fasciola hepatica TaxID=6192 RepID=A0A4E0REX5_FASHE|nr:hypothetical protein D915_003220 [Fasciola hepatica]